MKFDMLPDDFGRWIVQGAMTITGSPCKNNPSEGVSATPVASLTGQPAPKASATAAAPAAPPPTSLYIGEYACYGVRSRLMAGMGFRLTPDRKYADLDGKRGGTYVHDAAKATVAFRGGYLDGQVGKNVRAKGFDLTGTVSCEPWR